MVARHFLKFPFSHSYMEVHMLFQAGQEAVNEGNGTDVQGRLALIRRTGQCDDGARDGGIIFGY